MNEEKHWEMIVAASESIHDALVFKPDHLKKQYKNTIDGILDAYRWGDLNFLEAYSAILNLSGTRVSCDMCRHWEEGKLCGLPKSCCPRLVYPNTPKN